MQLDPLPDPSGPEMEADRRRAEIEALAERDPQKTAEFLRSLMDDRAGQRHLKTPLTGAQKAAVVLMNMDQQRAAQVMKQFSEEEADEITAEILRLRRVDPASPRRR